MTPARMAQIHATAFPEGPAWSEADITSLMNQPSGDAVILGDEGFALLRTLPPEAELLTIAIHPEAQGKGLGTALLKAALGHATLLGAKTLFLEVSEANSTARALYTRAGFAQIATRAGYYARKDGSRADALILSIALPERESCKTS